MNVDNLKRTRDYLAEHPDDYYQEEWTHDCGTPACVAGYAVVACGGTIVWDERCITRDGRARPIPNYAQELLALTPDQRDAMFSGLPYTPEAAEDEEEDEGVAPITCLLYTSPSPRDRTRSRMPSSA